MSNENKVLDFETQIKILKKAKINLKKFRCLCGSIGGSILDNSITTSDSAFIDSFIRKLIPLFNYSNAIIACNEKHVKIPRGDTYWWDRDNMISRQAMLNWMIDKLENKLFKIKILELAKDSHIRWNGYGVCFHISTVLYNETLIDYDYKHLDKIIPEFTYNNALLLAEKYNFTKPTGNEEGYWWDIFDKEPRLKFIEAMIEEIKK